MKRNRIPETDHGIQGADAVCQYDEMQRSLRDRVWMETDDLLQSGVQYGHALEVGHGPGYLGLEWLRRTQGTHLTGLDISADMTSLAKRNAALYGVTERVQYDTGKGDALPYADQSFDAVFTNGSLHEWVNPQGTFDEIYRVLRPGGRYFVSDLRRDMPTWMRWFLWLGTKPVTIRPYLFSSIDAAYTPIELQFMLAGTSCRGGQVTAKQVGLIVSGQKPV